MLSIDQVPGVCGLCIPFVPELRSESIADSGSAPLGTRVAPWVRNPPNSNTPGLSIRLLAR